jgi:hypothetical protein
MRYSFAGPRENSAANTIGPVRQFGAAMSRRPDGETGRGTAAMDRFLPALVAL